MKWATLPVPAGASPLLQSAVRGVSAVDPWLLAASLALLGLGLVMVTSASVGIADRSLGQPSYYLLRHALFIGLGLTAAVGAGLVPLAVWERLSLPLILCAIVLLALVLVPVLGRTVNGSTRWLAAGPFNVQVSELAKLLSIVYLAGYLVRRADEVRTALSGFLRPMLLLAVMVVLLLLEPDFGAAAVLLATALGMLWLGGARLWQFGLLLVSIAGGLAVLAVAAPYRLARLTAFLDPWADPFNTGFQLTQALIAFGRGEWFGVGLGASVQKLFYLPEAHTDFLFAVLAEELGLAGALGVIGLFALLVARAFQVARRAERNGQPFGAYLAYGLSMWIALQAFINLGVNMGLLPTKGLTLPLMSYGGSSLVVTCVAIALLLRVDFESRRAQGARPGGRQA